MALMDRYERRQRFLNAVLELARRRDQTRPVVDLEIIFAGADPDAVAWGRALFSGQTHAEARRKLRWPKRKAHATDCRWRRHLRRLGGGPERLTDRVRLDASRTVALHEFFDAASGRKLAYWEPVIQ